MVRVTTWLCRVPVIKFKKGGLVQTSAPPPSSAAASSPGSCPAPRSAAAAGHSAAAMSTGASIPDIDLPARYRRQPLSQEEIDIINGGGDDPPPVEKTKAKMLGVIKIPKGVLVSGPKGNEVVSLNIVLQKQEATSNRRQ